MYEKEFDSMRGMFAKRGRVEDGTLGAFEVILLLKNVTKSDIEKLKDRKIKFQGCYFNGINEDDPLKNFENVLLFKKTFKKESHLFTVAPRHEWLANQQDLSKFDKIIVRRADILDTENNKKLNEITLRTSDFKKMSPELKEKISFWVNFEKAGFDDVDTAKSFIKYAMDLGIGELVFTGRSSKYDRLFKSIRDLLIKSGFHFDINKAMNSETEFCSSTTLKSGKMKVVLKQIVEDEKTKNQMWLSSRSHKYIVEP